MPKGIGLSIGLNSVDPSHYAGWSGELNACEADAEDMVHIAKLQGFEVKGILTKKATANNVINNLSNSSKILQAGDIFMLSYSGHGGQIPDLDEDEFDSLDETWCLYDRQFIDDEFYYYLSKFRKGVRILVFIDSCHSGTVAKHALFKDDIDARSSRVDSKGVKYRSMPAGIIRDVYKKNKGAYDEILLNDKFNNSKDKVVASTIMISGCQDNQLSADGDFNGLFTSSLLRVWHEGAFQGNYEEFYRTILKRMPQSQSPQFIPSGKISKGFENQRPFTI